MTEYMELSEAIGKMDTGDEAEADTKGEYSDPIRFCLKGEQNQLRFALYDAPFHLAKIHFEWKWKIIPAEPEVLSNEALYYVSFPSNTKPSMPSPRELKCITLSNQNGRLERDLELRPLVEAVGVLHDRPDYDASSTINQRVIHEYIQLKNLKPLNPKEKT